MKSFRCLKNNSAGFIIRFYRNMCSISYWHPPGKKGSRFFPHRFCFVSVKRLLVFSRVWGRFSQESVCFALSRLGANFCFVSLKSFVLSHWRALFCPRRSSFCPRDGGNMPFYLTWRQTTSKKVVSSNRLYITQWLFEFYRWMGRDGIPIGMLFVHVRYS